MMGRRDNGPTHTEAGFSLIEVIVALALLALMAAMLTGIVNGSRQVFGILQRNEAVNSVGPVQTYLRAALTHAMILDGPSGPAARFEGDSRSMSFLTTHSLQGRFEGLYRIKFELRTIRTSQVSYDLIVTETLLRPADQDSGGPVDVRPSTLLPNVTGLSLAYYGRPDAAVDDWQWLTDWPFTDRLPALVRVDVSFAPGDHRGWQQMDIPLQIAQ